MKYFLFDADMTFLDFKTTEAISLKEIFENTFGLEFNEKTLKDYEIGNSWCWDKFEKAEITLENLEVLRWKLFIDRVGIDADPEKACRIYNNLLASNGLLLPGAKEFLENTRDLPKSLVTNGIAFIQHARLEATDTKKYFEHLFISQEMGTSKPQKSYFDLVLKTLGKKAEECVVIGDSEKSDIQGAVNAGIDSIYLNFQGKKSKKATWSVSSYKELETLLRTL
ncbi:MAG: YjjG family noncanonical pyrimidine nucleotidase [Spirochaetales bacterium]|nr:YjjG family noncanonical pyrimidine nucleotidase [Candidatus Physcosoma equi]